MSYETAKAVENWPQDEQIKESFVIRSINTLTQATESLPDSKVGRIHKRLAELAKIERQVVQQICEFLIRGGGAEDLRHQDASLSQIMVKGGLAKTGGDAIRGAVNSPEGFSRGFSA